jgi:hypothetical protein
VHCPFPTRLSLGNSSGWDFAGILTEYLPNKEGQKQKTIVAVISRSAEGAANACEAESGMLDGEADCSLDATNDNLSPQLQLDSRTGRQKVFRAE